MRGPQPRVEMLNPFGVRFWVCVVFGCIPGDSPRAYMLNPVGVLYMLGDRRISRGFSPGLNVIPLRGIFWTPTGCNIPTPGSTQGYHRIPQNHPAPRRGATFQPRVLPGDFPPRDYMLNPVGVLYMLGDRRISRGFSPGLHVIPLRGIFLDPNGVQHLNPGFYPGITPAPPKQTWTPTGSNISTQGSTLGQPIQPVPTQIPARGYRATPGQIYPCSSLLFPTTPCYSLPHLPTGISPTPPK